MTTGASTAVWIVGFAILIWAVVVIAGMYLRWRDKDARRLKPRGR